MDAITASPVPDTAEKRFDQKQTERMVWIDAVKGIGIFLVVVGHCLMDADILRNWIYSFHVPLFFLISGYLSASRYAEGQIPSTAECCSFVKKKLGAYLYPYVTFSILSLLWYVLFYHILGNTHQENLTTVVLKMVTTYGHNANWFLPALYWMSVISFFTRRAGRGRPLIIFFMAILGCVAAALVHTLPEFRNRQCYAMRYVFRIMIAVSFDYIGEVVFRGLQRCSVKTEQMLLVLCGIISVGLFWLNPDVSLFAIRIHNWILFYVLALAGSLFVILLCRNTILGRSRLLVFLGDHSLIIMALHMDFPKEIGWTMVGAAKLTRIAPVSLASVCVGIVACAVSALCAVWISRHARFLLRRLK